MSGDPGVRPGEVSDHHSAVISPYREFEFTRDSVRELRRHGFREGLAVAIIKYPHSTKRAEDGAVISCYRNQYGMQFEVEHEPQREEQGEGIPAILDTVIRQFRVYFPDGTLV